MVSDAVFLSGLPKMITEYNGNRQEPWKVGAVYHYIQDRYLKPDFIVDITSVMQERMEAVKAFTSQFYNATSTEPETAISSKAFLEFLIARAREFGRPAGVEFAEGFQAERTICLKDPFELK
jgi:LmbE family N-acetylglucosaminyl deacetylase